jgi:hypothetical protein
LNAPEILQSVECALDAPTKLVETLAEAKRLLSVVAIWNDRLGPCFDVRRVDHLCVYRAAVPSKQAPGTGFPRCRAAPSAQNDYRSLLEDHITRVGNRTSDSRFTPEHKKAAHRIGDRNPRVFPSD